MTSDGYNPRGSMHAAYYLETPIVGRKTTETPRYGRCVDGYTRLSGAPTHTLIRLQGENRWRRVMFWCFSNVGTLFVRINGRNLIVRDYDIPTGDTKDDQ